MLVRSLASRFESGSSMRNDARLADQCPSHRDSLALAPGERRGLPVQELAEAEHLSHRVDPRA